MNKGVISILCFIFFVAVSMKVYSDELGCCINPGAGPLACSSERLSFREAECCPKPESNYASYYKSIQNPFNPNDYNDCSINFFFINKDCSTIDECSLGCCCSDLGGTIKPGAQCKGSQLKFFKGQTNCNQICPVPQCSDGLDNDNNGCADFDGGDTGCSSKTDNDESGGKCIRQSIACLSPSYIPKLSNLEITPAKGQRNFSLKWQDECNQNVVSYNILRCEGANCSNFEELGITASIFFVDSSANLAFDVFYTYQVRAKYSIQTATPNITKSATLGSRQCFNKFFTDFFCLNNSAYNCDQYNQLIPEGTKCTLPKICVIQNKKPVCLVKSNCNYDDANPFGMFYIQSDCETNRYCFYDRSYSTSNSCFSCDPGMSCYDYKFEEACRRDNCNIRNCKWKNSADQIGIGVCVSTIDSNCQWCTNKGTSSLENLRSFNEIFDFCTQDKAELLSEGKFKCYYNEGLTENCKDVTCSSYALNQCKNETILHDEFNKIKNPSFDKCGIGVCQNINNVCVKNADGDKNPDCSDELCEKDYFQPNTMLAPTLRKGIVDDILVQIYDKTSANSSSILKTSQDYKTYLCVEPCGAQGHPYRTYTNSKKIIISNLNAYDGNNGSKILSFNEGNNIIRYYSQDPANNLGEVQKLPIQVSSNSTGPKIFSIEISGGSKILDKYYTNNKKPSITIKFVEPAIITFANLINTKTSFLESIQGNTQLATTVNLLVKDVLQDGEYTLELNAKNKDNIFMDPPLSVVVIVDTTKPNLSIQPSGGEEFNVSTIDIKLTFDKEVKLQSVTIDKNEIKNLFLSTDNKIFTSTVTLPDGNKKLEVYATDYANNQVYGLSEFTIDANPTVISLINPKFGVASSYTFGLAVGTDNNAVCRYSLDNNFDYEFMDQFSITGGTVHNATNFNQIKSGDAKTHKLIVKCQDKRGATSETFDISVNTVPPQINSAFAYPNPVVEKPSNTTLTIETDAPTICKYSNNTGNFDNMEGKFEGFDEGIFKTINKQSITIKSEGTFTYFVACENKAEIKSNVREIPITVNLNISLSIIPRTPEFLNSTNIVLAVETNKISQCKYSETDATALSGEIFGAPSYIHTRQMTLNPGKHTFYVACKDQFLQRLSDVVPVIFTIDITPPIVLSVDDSSTLADNPDYTWSTDSLRVKWNSEDKESRVRSHLYSLIDSGTSNVIIDWTRSYVNNEWIIVSKSNGTNLILNNGSKYLFRVRAENIVGLQSDVKDSDGITIDVGLKPLNCTNNLKDGKESDIDCGGGCKLCEIGNSCSQNSDCKPNSCKSGICSTPTCEDNAKNQDESDMDCGGTCKKCELNKACTSKNDCATNFCSFGFCKPLESCYDTKFSPGESDVDCGGFCPQKCSDGMKCNKDYDCDEGSGCKSGICEKGAREAEQNFVDSDGDGMPDDWEIQHGLNPNDPNDAKLDNDKDGLTNLEEYQNIKVYGKSTDPNKADTDGDKFSDKKEIDKDTNPVDPESFPKSSLTKVLLLILGVLILISGFGFLAYRVLIERKKTSSFEMSKERLPARTIPTQAIRYSPLQKKEDTARIRQELQKKELLKQKERARLFEGFAKEEEKQKEQKIKVEPKPVTKEHKITKDMNIKKSKEDVFKKLQEIAKEPKKKTKNKT